MVPRPGLIGVESGAILAIRLVHPLDHDEAVYAGAGLGDATCLAVLPPPGGEVAAADGDDLAAQPVEPGRLVHQVLVGRQDVADAVNAEEIELRFHRGYSL